MEIFSFNEIPFSDLQLIGLNKEKIMLFDKEELASFLSSQRTNVRRFEFYYNGKRYQLDAKLRLKRNDDNSVKVDVIPVRRQIQNDFNLTNDELLKLYAGKLINKSIDGNRCVLQLDRETCEVLCAKTSNIKLPFDIEPKEKEKLLTGKSIIIKTDSGEHSLKLDFLNPKRYAIDEEKQEMRYVGSYFTKTDIPENKYNLSENNIQLILDGYKSNIINYENNKGRLKLMRNEDKSTCFVFFPVNNEINNNLGLSHQDIEKLKRGETVMTFVEGRNFICQLDLQTNDILTTQTENLLPETIRGYKLKGEEKETLLKGLSLHFIVPSTNENVSVKLNLNHISGLEIKDDVNILRQLYMAGDKANEILEKNMKNDIQKEKFLSRNLLDKKDLANTARVSFDERQKYFFDYHNPGVVGYIKTDNNRNDFISLMQEQNKVISFKV